MAAEELLIELFESHWFGHAQTPSPQQNPFLETQQQPLKVNAQDLPTLHVGSTTKTSSDDHLSLSPVSVLSSGEVKNPTRGWRRSTGRRKKVSMSTWELEFDEVKGFMDLGFLFSEEDKGSSLVSIIPGLQRFGSREEDKVFEETHIVVSRPYLSEAWDDLERIRLKEKLKAMMINWSVPSLGSDVDMKGHLKLWAHSVASTVR